MAEIIKTEKGFEIKLRGIIPNPINAPRCDVEEHSIVNETRELVSVVAGTKLHITSIWLCGTNGAATIQTAYMVVRDNLNADVVRLLALKLYTNTEGHFARLFYPGKEVITLYDVAIVSPIASYYVDGGLSGWVENV